MNVLIVEDDAEYAATLGSELGALDHTVQIVKDGAAGLHAVERYKFDAVILTSRMPRLRNNMVVQRLRERGQTVPVLMLSTHGAVSDKIAALDAGADDYVVMPAETVEIEARLRSLIRARSWRSGAAETIRAGSIVVSPGHFRAWHAGRSLDLTRREMTLLTELVRHAGSYLTRAMLLLMVWNVDYTPEANVVDVQIRALRGKLTSGGEDDPILTKRGVGYMLRGADLAPPED